MNEPITRLNAPLEGRYLATVTFVPDLWRTAPGLQGTVEDLGTGYRVCVRKEPAEG